MLMDDLEKIYEPNTRFSLDKKTLLEEVVRRKNEEDDRRMTEMVQTQLSIIFLESYCTMIVNLEPKITLEEEMDQTDDVDDGFWLLEDKMKQVTRSREMFSLHRQIFKITSPGQPSLIIPNYISLLKNCVHLQNKNIEK